MVEGAWAGAALLLRPLGEGRKEVLVWTHPPIHCQVGAGWPPRSLIAQANSTAEQPGRTEQSVLGTSTSPSPEGEQLETEASTPPSQGSKAGGPPLPSVSQVMVGVAVEGGSMEFFFPRVCPGSQQPRVQPAMLHLTGNVEEDCTVVWDTKNSNIG